MVVQPVRRRRSTAPPTLRALYLRACGHGHPDTATAVRETLGADLDTVLTRWRQWLTG